MQETLVPPDPGFVVEWQLADDADDVVDLATAESQEDQSGRATSSSTVPTRR